MTWENAHECIEDLQRVYTQYRYMFHEDLIRANGKAIEAIEKQIPKKIKGGRYAGACECGRFVLEDQNFCPQCGQAIDWSMK